MKKSNGSENTNSTRAGKPQLAKGGSKRKPLSTPKNKRNSPCGHPLPAGALVQVFEAQDGVALASGLQVVARECAGLLKTLAGEVFMLTQALPQNDRMMDHAREMEHRAEKLAEQISDKATMRHSDAMHLLYNATEGERGCKVVYLHESGRGELSKRSFGVGCLAQAGEGEVGQFKALGMTGEQCQALELMSAWNQTTPTALVRQAALASLRAHWDDLQHFAVHCKDRPREVKWARRFYSQVAPLMDGREGEYEQAI